MKRSLSNDDNDNRPLTHEERLKLIYAPIKIGTVANHFAVGHGRSIMWEEETNYSMKNVSP